MAFSRASSCAAGSTESARSNARDVVPTWALELFQVYCRSIPLIELIIELVPWALHPVEDVEAPVNDMKVISVLVCANVAHTCVTAETYLKPFHVRILILVMDTARRYI